MQIEQFHIHKPPRTIKKRPELQQQNFPVSSQYVETNRNFQTFVFNADDVSLEALLDPNFRPMSSIEQQQKAPPIPIVYQQMQPARSSTSTNQKIRYERASFDPYEDSTSPAPFLTIPTRRRQQILNNSSIFRL